MACVTETWFRNGRDLSCKLDEVEDEKGVKFLHRSRDGRRRKGGGGVAIAFRPNLCNLKQRQLSNIKREHEVICATGRVGKMLEKVAIFAIYIPPDTRAAEFRDLCEAVEVEIAAVKVALNNPVVVIGGDFNNRDMGQALSASEVYEIDSEPTRGIARLDRVLCDRPSLVNMVKKLPPLETLAGGVSDHRCIYLEINMPKVRNFKWVVRLRRKRNAAREQEFASDLGNWDWSGLREAGDVSSMAALLENSIATLTERHFPLVRVRRRSNEDPWITRSIRRLWKKKIRIYQKGGKSDRWWEIDRRLQDEIEDSKEAFVEKLLEEGNNGRNFYSATRKLATASTTPAWTVSDLFIGMEPGEVCEEVLKFFGAIAASGDPGIEMTSLPRLAEGLPVFPEPDVEKLLKQSKKTDSAVPGDPLPHLIRTFPREFAAPVTEIFNRINNNGSWPRQWKIEHLTVIPKTSNPSDLSECRNISCTSAFSNILENQVLLQLRKEIPHDPAQYGGVPKCGAEHMLVDIWEEVLAGLEGGKSAAVLLGVDYEKTFNRMEHSVCIRKLRRRGASPGSLSLVRAFLENRFMTISINGVKASRPVPITRGSPQGSVLGCFLYCITTQALTENLRPGRGPGVFMYVDDTTLLDVVDCGDATIHLTTDKAAASFENLRLEADLLELSRRTLEINMKMNMKKTQLLVIAPPNGYNTSAQLTNDETVTRSSEKLKLVGFTFGDVPGVEAHVQSIKDKFRRKVWMLYHLRRAGFRRGQLYRLYCCYVRSVVEYCSVVYHPMLTAGQALELERLHRLAIRICFGFGVDISLTMNINGIESLEARRARRCDSFIRKAVRNPRFKDRWFPPREGEVRDLRRRRNIQEVRANTLRRFRSPLAFLQRSANELGLSNPE